MVTAAGRKVLQKAIFSFWERIPRRKTGELQKQALLAFFSPAGSSHDHVCSLPLAGSGLPAAHCFHILPEPLFAQFAHQAFSAYKESTVNYPRSYDRGLMSQSSLVD